MTQSTPNASSSHGSESFDEAQHMPNTGSYSVAPNTLHGAAPTYTPLAPFPGVVVGVPQYEFQAGQNGCYPLAMASATDNQYPPPQYPFAFSLYHQPFPLNAFPGANIPYALPPPHQEYLHPHHGSGLQTGFSHSFIAQVPGLVVDKKCVAEDDTKEIKIYSFRGIKNDPLFTPVLNQHGEPNGTFMCSKDGVILHSDGYSKHIRSRKHLGYKLEKFKCPASDCSRSYARSDACKRHWDNGCGKRAPEGSRMSYRAACQAAASSASAAPVVEPAPALTHPYPYPYPMPVIPMSGNVQFTPPAPNVAHWYGTPYSGEVAEPAENDKDEDDDADFWDANEIQDVDEM
ncbi:hypothetical protein BDR07DRAFT_1481255 [Suillus spraguei]|nr:hypothetical protein BDR07DRAFT_1481255 [Suillus spraguei]